MAFMLWLSIFLGLIACGDEKKKEGIKDEEISQPAPQPNPAPPSSPGSVGGNTPSLPLPGGDSQNPFPNPCDVIPYPIPGCPTNPSPNPTPQPSPRPPVPPDQGKDPREYRDWETLSSIVTGKQIGRAHV